MTHGPALIFIFTEKHFTELPPNILAHSSQNSKSLCSSLTMFNSKLRLKILWT